MDEKFINTPVPEQYKNNDVVEAYRSYYLGEKKDFATWKSETPYWFMVEDITADISGNP